MKIFSALFAKADYTGNETKHRNTQGVQPTDDNHKQR